MSFTIGRVEKTSPYLLADLVELIAALGLDGRSAFRPDDVVSLCDGQPQSEEDEEEDDEGGDNQRERRTLLDSVNDAWTHIAYRAQRFGTSYPFQLTNRAIRLRTGLSQGARIYRMLLACSRLRSFSRQTRQRWAKDFVHLSREALVRLMPTGAAVKIFDANSEDRRTHFTTNLRTALPRLGEDLGAYSINAEECARASTSGDAGIDLVAIASWSDTATGTHAVLGQCAAQQENWPQKRLEAHPLALRAYFTFFAEPINAVFIPVMYRGTDGMWTSNPSVSGCLLIDRLRIMILLEGRAVQSVVINAPWFTRFEGEFAATAAAIPARAA